MTLIEVVSVFAILSVLAFALASSIGPRMEANRVKRATRDVETIARALRVFWRTTGVWPCKDASGDVDGLRVLCSGPNLPGSNPWSGSSAWWSAFTSGDADVFDHHLFANRPGANVSASYAASGVKAWRGPYTHACPLDPWGRPYVALVAAGRASASGSDPVQLLVLSAGPNGAIDTPASGAASVALQADDIGLVAWRRS